MARPAIAFRSVALAVTLALGTGAFLSPSTSDAAPMGRAIRPWLGVSMDGERGTDIVRVRHVVRTSPADKAGVRTGDRIMRVEGSKVGTPDDVIRGVVSRAVGETLN